MSSINEKIVHLIDPGIPFEEMAALRPYRLFDPNVMNFLEKLSAEILHDKDCKPFPDVITFGFFCRKGSLRAYRDRYQHRIENRLGRGLTWHVTPSNVPVNFAYSMVAGLLSGNPVIVRVSSKEFEQTSLICRAISRVLQTDGFQELAGYISIVQYPRDKEINDFFASLCSVRVIWGGDGTIRDIRRSPLQAQAFDILFADRYSMCLVDAAAYLAMKNKEEIAQKFFNDTYLFDQNACTAPHLVYWTGTGPDIETARQEFWRHLRQLVAGRYQMASILAMDKLVAVCSAAVSMDGAVLEDEPDNLIQRVRLDSLAKDLPEHRCAGGLFYEYISDSYDEIADIAEKQYQTLSVIGYQPEEIAAFLLEKQARGIDRVVTVGNTMNFDFIWDGYDLPLVMSRVVSFQ